tara:strand:+ start:899 stop:1273 length:375 start_codon:yes stop_codon:yes gene_type:complete
MKKILVILFVSLIVSCAGNDDNTTNKSINPPSWIQGIWALNDSATVGGVAFDFRADDFCQGQFGIGFTCWKAQGTYFDNFSVFEEVSNTRYFVILSYAGGEQTFEFDKVSDTSIMYNEGSFTKQ